MTIQVLRRQQTEVCWIIMDAISDQVKTQAGKPTADPANGANAGMRQVVRAGVPIHYFLTVSLCVSCNKICIDLKLTVTFMNL